MNSDQTSSRTPPLVCLPPPELPQPAPGAQPPTWRLPVRFDPNPSTDETSSDARVRHAYEFEGLLVDILARFVNLPSEEVHSEIEHALNRVCEFLGLDRAGLWHRRQSGARLFVLTHQCVRLQRLEPALGADDPNPAGAGPVHQPEPEARALPLGTELDSYSPHLTAQVKRGKTVVFSNLGDSPQEATSSIAIPVLVQGEVLAAVTFEMLPTRAHPPRADKPWPEPLIKRLEFVAEVFAQATARKLSDEKLRASEAHLSLAAASAEAALWSLDLRTGRIHTTPKGLELLHLSPASDLSFEQFLNMVHPDDRDLVRRTAQVAGASRKEFNVEFRVVRPGGNIRWVSTTGRCHYSPTATPERLMGVSANITERKHAENLLRESETRFRSVADSAPVLIWMAGPDKLCNFFNKPWLEFTGRTPEQEHGNGWS